MRHFFVCISGKNPDQTVSFSNFGLQTKDRHPSMREIKGYAEEKFPGLRDIVLISISELNGLDWFNFTSEQ